MGRDSVGSTFLDPAHAGLALAVASASTTTHDPDHSQNKRFMRPLPAWHEKEAFLETWCSFKGDATFIRQGSEGNLKGNG
jgi:hypothetical protein